MRKDLEKAIKATAYRTIKEYIFLFGKYIAFIILFLYLFVNITAAQAMNTLYFQFVSGSQTAASQMLKDIRQLPQFPQIFSQQEHIFGSSISFNVNQESVRNRQQITQYEEMLSSNPNSRDLLYALYLLYKEEGNTAQANLYFQKAQSIDPMLNK